MATSKSILIIVENLPVPFDRRVWQEATALKAAGYAVSVICPKGKGFDLSHEVIDGIAIYRHALPLEAAGAAGFALEYGAALLAEAWLSVRVWRRHGIDAIHACNPPDLIFLIGGTLKALVGTKFVFDHHDILPELYEAKFGARGFFHRLLRFFERRTFKAADVSIATNDTFKDIAVQRGGMAPEKVWVVKSYPDFARFYRVAPDPALRNGRQHLIGYVGIMGAQDGVDHLLRAMHHLVTTRRRSDIHCLIVGDGPERRSLEALSAELGLEAFVTFAGYLTGGDLLTHFSTMDVGVIPDPHNAYNDKISMNKVFEYMAMGIPFVMYDLAESRRTAGEAALVAAEHTPESLGEAILALVDDPARRREMSDHGAARAQAEFQWSQEKDKLLAAYAEVFAE